MTVAEELMLHWRDQKKRGDEVWLSWHGLSPVALELRRWAMWHGGTNLRDAEVAASLAMSEAARPPRSCR